MSKPLRLAADTPPPSPDDGLAARIAEWRQLARRCARGAIKEIQDDDGDHEKAAAIATMATMYYAVALDAHTFGNLPDIDEEVS